MRLSKQFGAELIDGEVSEKGGDLNIDSDGFGPHTVGRFRNFKFVHKGNGEIYIEVGQIPFAQKLA